ncbi:penicillin-binding protein 2 [Clostridium malenominatum]|uniref:Penicillin-binding protein 2 n=1 Tax=Clostridium malenominatum TaxID=1539 RepID=A0ABP3TVJ8_9CLOT
MKGISNNIKKVTMVFLICFIGLISYITYFQINVAPKIVSSQYNQKRVWAKKNEVLRGSIFDRNMKVLAKSTRTNRDNQKREYPEGQVFAHPLGYIDISYGLSGLERRYDKELSSVSIKDTISNLMNINKSNKEKYGSSLKTTLDYNLQKLGWDLLGQRRGAIVALDPKSGEILALVSKPSFNPNDLKGSWEEIVGDKNNPLLNRTTSGLYTPGSVFKVVTAVSALENIKDTKTRIFEDKGVLVFNSKESLRNYNGAVLGNIDFKEAMVKSSNVVFGKMGMELGNNKLKDTAEKFYFNNNIPSNGMVIENSRFPSIKSYEVGNLAQSAIGQSSILATPIQMALVAGTIGNDGVMMKPTLVKEILNNTGEVLDKIKSDSLGRVTSKENAAIIKEAMKAVVERGTGQGAGVYGISICGKTGTAEHSIEGKAATPHSWFIGFAPYEDPTIALAVIVEEGGVGGGIASSIASAMFKKALSK